MFKILFFISILPIYLADSLRAIPITIVEKEESYNISSSVEWFVDEDAQFKADDIPEGKLLQYFNPPLKHMLNLGHMDNPVWCRFSVKNQKPGDLYLKIKNPNIDSLSIYVFNRAGDLIYFHQTGDYVPSRQREIYENNFFFNLHILPDENYTVYLRARSMASSLYLPLYLAPLKVFFNNSFIEDSLQAMYFGLILFIIIYNLFLFVILKQPEHFYFAAFVFFLGLVFSINTGYAIQYLWGNQTWLNQFSGIFSAMVGIFIILFTSSLFKSKEETPRRHIWFLALIGIYFLLIIIDLLGAPLIAYRFLLYNIVFTFIFVMSISISSLRSGFKPAGYYILAWPFFLAGVLIYVLRDFDVISFNQDTA
jgi:hypothetical protein